MPHKVQNTPTAQLAGYVQQGMGLFAAGSPAHACARLLQFSISITCVYFTPLESVHLAPNFRPAAHAAGISIRPTRANSPAVK